MALASFVPALDVYQMGVESVRGTRVAATEKMAISRLNVDESGVRYLPQLAKGLLLANRGNEVVVTRGTTFEIPETAFNYEQHMRFLGMSVQGGVSASGCMAPYTWAFARSLTADPDPDTYTIERRRSDGSNNEDIEFGYALLSQIRWVFAQNEALRWSASGFARKVQSSTLTGALSMPTPEIPPAALITAYLDTSYAGLGNTQLTSQVLGGEVVFDTGFMPQMTADGRTDLDFTTHLLNAEAVRATVRLQCLINSSRLATERAAAAAQTLRAIQLDVQGGSSKQFTLNMLVKYPKPDILAAEDRDGQWIVTLELETTTDGSNPSFEATLINTVAT